MDEDTARAIQTVAALIAVSVITVTAILHRSQPSGGTLSLIGSAFVLIASLLGVHYGIVNDPSRRKGKE